MLIKLTAGERIEVGQLVAIDPATGTVRLWRPPVQPAGVAEEAIAKGELITADPATGHWRKARS